ncbi:hypothetical protein EDD21DRAFT_366134 [Dissophora ornata]|nr:hypothetical protein EDD21DRAFT_366134 [Dissophora ornata]
MDPSSRVESRSPPPGIAPDLKKKRARIPVAAGNKGESVAAPRDFGPNLASRASGASGTSRRRAKERFENEDLAVIITWLEHPPNYASIYGTHVNHVEAAPWYPVVTKTKGWEDLATHFNKQSKGYWNISSRNMQDRFSRFRNTYKDAREIIKSPGFGITDTDRANGIHRLEHKRESLCFAFDRMEAIFATKDPLREIHQSLAVGFRGRTTRQLPDDDEGGGVGVDDGSGEVEDDVEQTEVKEDDSYEDVDVIGHGYLNSDYAADDIEVGAIPGVGVDDGGREVESYEDVNVIGRGYLDSNYEEDDIGVGAIPDTISDPGCRIENEIASVTSRGSSQRKRTASVSSSTSNRKAPHKLNTSQFKEKGSSTTALVDSVEKRVEVKQLFCCYYYLSYRICLFWDLLSNTLFKH